MPSNTGRPWHVLLQNLLQPGPVRSASKKSEGQSRPNRRLQQTENASTSESEGSPERTRDVALAVRIHTSGKLTQMPESLPAARPEAVGSAGTPQVVRVPSRGEQAKHQDPAAAATVVSPVSSVAASPQFARTASAGGGGGRPGGLPQAALQQRGRPQGGETGSEQPDPGPTLLDSSGRSASVSKGEPPRNGLSDADREGPPVELAAARLWSRSDWLLVTKVLDLASRHGPGGAWSLPESSRARAQMLMIQLCEARAGRLPGVGVAPEEGLRSEYAPSTLGYSDPFDASSAATSPQRLLDAASVGTASDDGYDVAVNVSRLAARSARAHPGVNQGGGAVGVAVWGTGTPGTEGVVREGAVPGGIPLQGLLPALDPAALERQQRLLFIATQAVPMCEADKTPNGVRVAEFLLNQALELTQSKIGFIGSVHRRANGAGYLKTHAISNVAWTPELHQWYTDRKDKGLVFTNLDTLFGAIIQSATTVISNSPESDPRASGTPPGHPKIRSFLGLPIFAGDALIGACGLANRDGGYSLAMVQELEPFTTAVSQVLQKVLGRSHQAQHQQSLPHQLPGKAQGQVAKDAFLAFDARGVLTSMNRRAEGLIGASAIGKFFADLFFPANGNPVAVLDLNSLLAASASEERLRALVRCAGGASRPVELAVSRGATGQSQFVVTLSEEETPAPPAPAGEHATAAHPGPPQPARRPAAGVPVAPQAFDRQASAAAVAPPIPRPTSGEHPAPRQPTRFGQPAGVPTVEEVALWGGAQREVAGAGAGAPPGSRELEADLQEPPVPAPGSLQERVISAVLQVHEIFETDFTPNGCRVAEFMLAECLQLTESTIGFIASIHYRSNGAAYIKTHAISNIAWTPELRQWYTDNWERGLVFTNMDTLFGSVLTTAGPVISNSPASDPRSTGTPPGHVKLQCFMGIPLYSDGEAVGVYGVANRQGGYSQELVGLLEPFTRAMAVILSRILEVQRMIELQQLSLRPTALSANRSPSSEHGGVSGASALAVATRESFDLSDGMLSPAQDDDVAAEVKRLSMSVDTVRHLAATGGSVCPITGQGAARAKVQHRSPWETDVGPAACPYLGGAPPPRNPDTGGTGPKPPDPYGLPGGVPAAADGHNNGAAVVAALALEEEKVAAQAAGPIASTEEDAVLVARRGPAQQHLGDTELPPGHRAAATDRDEEAVKKEWLMWAVVRAHEVFSTDMTANGNEASEFLLSRLIEFTQSEFGFIASVHKRVADGAMYIKTHAISNLAWSPELHQWYTDKKTTGLVFSNMDTLFGAVARSGELLISNDPSSDPRASGTPPGHAKLTSFLGIPLRSGPDLVGVIGLANREDGYDTALVEDMESLTRTVAHITTRVVKRNKIQQQRDKQRRPRP